MSGIQKQLKTDPVSGIFALAGEVWKPVMSAYILTSILSLILILPLMYYLFGDQFGALMEMGQDPQLMQDPQLVEEIGQNMLSKLKDPLAIVGLIGIIILSVVSQSYTAVVALLSNEERVAKRALDIKDILTRAFSPDVFRIFIAQLLLYIFAMLLMFLPIVIGGLVGSMVHSSFGGMLGFIGFIVGLATSMRLWRTLPAMIHGKKGLFDAISYSFQETPWPRAFTYILYGILIFIALAVVSTILSMVQLMLGMVPGIGFILSQAASIVIGGFTAALMYSTLSAMYYRRVEDVGDPEMDITEHLIR